MQRIAFIGPPNVGKSSLFARLTGAYAPVGNWAGLTVEVNRARVLWCGQMLEVLDLPGFYALQGGGEEERLAQSLVAATAADLWLLVLDAVQLPRQLPLLKDVLARGLPLVVLINQMDEARRLGIRVDAERLQQHLGVPVLAVSGRECVGLADIEHTVCAFLRQPPRTHVPVVSLAHDWLDGVWQAPSVAGDSLTERLDAVLLHPRWGLPLFGLIMLVLYQAVFWLGGGIQDVLSDLFAWGQEGWLQPAVSGLPDWAQGLLVDGVYAGLTTLLTFVPLVALFFFLLAALSDSGYLARMAFLADGIMARLGLEGRSLVLTVMGMGCNVPAILGARIIPDRRMRWLTQLMMPFALCSARLQVFVFLAAALFAPWQAALVVLGLYVLSVLAALLTAWLGQKAMKPLALYPMVMEMPPYRLPHWSQALRTAWVEVLGFLRRASGLIVLGVVAVWLLLNLPVGVESGSADSWAAQVAHLLAPVFAPMGMPELFVLALLFGLVAKEVVLGGLMVLLGVSEVALAGAVAASLSVPAALALMVFVLLYTPCLATIAVLRQEGGWKLAATSLVWSLVFAWLAAVAVYQLGSWLF